MKYIRTKDGNIYDINKEYSGRHLSIEEKRAGPYKKEIKLIFNGKGGWFGKRIERESDTIEELCDVFIDGNCLDELNGCFYEKYENKSLWFKPQDKLELRPISILEWSKEERTKIKGAIWTDKGLIYVAKMNEKGEFELL